MKAMCQKFKDFLIQFVDVNDEMGKFAKMVQNDKDFPDGNMCMIENYMMCQVKWVSMGKMFQFAWDVYEMAISEQDPDYPNCRHSVCSEVYLWITKCALCGKGIIDKDHHVDMINGRKETQIEQNMIDRPLPAMPEDYYIDKF